MRAALLALLVACGPKVSTKPPSFDEDLAKPAAQPAAALADELTMERQVAPPGKGLRSGTIARDRLVAILDAGPASFLRNFEVSAKMSGDRFVGWELVQLVGKDNLLYDLDLAPGDVLLAVNGQAISRPDQLQTLWDSLRTANAVTAQLWRGQTQLTLDFIVEPKLPTQPQ